MPEVLFVLKAFIVSIILTLCLQVKVGQASVETHAENWLANSAIPNYLQKASSGAVLALKNTTEFTKKFVAKTFNPEPQTNRASRLNLDLKRSSAYEEQNGN